MRTLRSSSMTPWLLAAILAMAAVGCRRNAGSGGSRSSAATPSPTATPESGSAASLETSPEWTAAPSKPAYAVSGLETPTRAGGYAASNEATTAPAPTWDPSEPSAEQKRRQSKGY